jgi:lysophospholipase L1-like esterase
LKKGDYPYRDEEAFCEVLEWEPDIVIIELGTNDSKDNNWKYNDEFERDYAEFINIFKQSENRPRVYVCRPLPLFPGNTIGIDDSRMKNEIIPKIDAVAAQTEVDIIDLYTPFSGRADYTYDNLHPNAIGTNIMAREVFKTLCPDSKIPPMPDNSITLKQNNMNQVKN